MTAAVSIIIPTFRRPQRAVEAARSALAQDIAMTFEVVLVDNDPEGSALSALRALKDPRIVVVHEPRTGVANARNAGLRAARGDVIAFLDDDQVAPPEWLSELMRVQRTARVDVVFGPVWSKLATLPRDHEEYFNAFFSRDPGHAEGEIDAFYGCGCSLVLRGALPSAEPFSAAHDETGGQCESLFEQMQAQSARFAWAPGAHVWETPEPSRVTLGYTLKRAFAHGQGFTRKAWAGPKRDLAAVGASMAAGAGQCIVHGVVALGCFLGKTRERAFAYRRLVEGAGKLFWFPLFKPRVRATNMPKVKTATA